MWLCTQVDHFGWWTRTGARWTGSCSFARSLFVLGYRACGISHTKKRNRVWSNSMWYQPQAKNWSCSTSMQYQPQAKNWSFSTSMRYQPQAKNWSCSSSMQYQPQAKNWSCSSSMQHNRGTDSTSGVCAIYSFSPFLQTSDLLAWGFFSGRHYYIYCPCTYSGQSYSQICNLYKTVIMCYIKR